MARMQLLWLTPLLIGCMSASSVGEVDANDVARSRTNLGLAYLEHGQWQRARQNIEIALQAAPDNVHAHVGLAYYLQKVNEDNQAMLQYEKALSLAPNEPDLLNNYGVFLCHIGEYAKAEKAFLRAIKQKGYYKLSVSYENAGLCAIKFNHVIKAKNWFEKAVSHEPNRYLSTLYLSKLDFALSECALLEARLRTFHQRYGYHAATLLALIKIEKHRGYGVKIEKYARLLEEKFPQSQEYRQYLDNEF